VPRDRGDVRRRLQEKAVELFLRKGYEATTALEIAAGVGVTERTFFRYFPDKRDVLFDEEKLHAGLGAAIASAPAEAGPLGMVSWAFSSIAPMFENNRPISEPAQTIIAQTAALQERQLTKTAAVTQSIAAALARRDIAQPVANLAAAAGMAVAAHALQMWFRDPSLPLVARFETAFGQLATMSEAMRPLQPPA
jgi:AcrR family transcriptional regulator